MSLSQVSFAAFAQHTACPPPPASANGSVLSLAAPAEPGVGVDTPYVYRCLCQDCAHVQVYPDGEAWLDAHGEKTFCELCGTGVMCGCAGCVGWIAHHVTGEA